MSEKTRNSSYRASKTGQKHVRKFGQGMPVKLDVESLKINLGHLVASLSAGRKDAKVHAYEQIAADMSKLAGLNGNFWTWRYVASVNSGSVEPSKKFLRVLNLFLEKVNPHNKQWFYFVRRRSVAAVYDKCVLREQLADHMQGLGFKPATFSRYMQVKCAATRQRCSKLERK